MSTLLSSLVPDLRLELPGCIDLTITRELRQACREFCEKTGCWEVVLDPVSVTAGTDTCSLTLPDDAALVSLVALTRDGLPFTAYQMHLPELELVLNELPDSEIELVPTVHLMPTRTATTIPDILERDYFEGIRCLTLSRLMQMAGVPWGNLQGAARYAAQARRLQGRATVRRWRERSGDRPLTVNPQPFA
jgi:hypothetical protein